MPHRQQHLQRNHHKDQGMHHLGTDAALCTLSVKAEENVTHQRRPALLEPDPGVLASRPLDRQLGLGKSQELCK